MADPRFPIGRFAPARELTDGDRGTLIARLAACPAALRRAVTGLTDAQLETPYRSGGWTVRQVVHHVPDSHMNGLIRFKLALTEDAPTIRPYDQDAWASLEVGRSGILGVSDLGLRPRWAFNRSPSRSTNVISAAAFGRTQGFHRRPLLEGFSRVVEQLLGYR